MPIDIGRSELRAAFKTSRGLIWSVGLFSFFANLLMLTGPLYMLQVYDRVLGSRSEETLVALSVLVVFLYTIMGVVDYARGRIMARFAARFVDRMQPRVFDAVLRKTAETPTASEEAGLQDLEAVQRCMTSPVLLAFFDIPWTPLFLLGIIIFHPWLGALAVMGAVSLVVITLLNQVFSRRLLSRSSAAQHHATVLSERMRSDAEMLRALGMQAAAFSRWSAARKTAMEYQVRAGDLGGKFAAVTKTFRLVLQSAMLGLGAYLALLNQISPGVMIAGSILLGRALVPIEIAIGQWAVVHRAVSGWRGIDRLLAEVPPKIMRTKLPVPASRLEVQDLTVVPPGATTASLRMINFSLPPGMALGVIGPSGAGKTTLARTLIGLWRPAGGKVRLDGAPLDQYDGDDLAQYIGYLPQRVQLFDGSIADNIAKLSTASGSEQVILAARAAGAHEMIVNLPDGYDTEVTATGGRLSGGQVQRIGLARALYSDPAVLVLDEPNSNLDNEGALALNQAIRAMKSRGKSVLIMAHRPAAIQECDLLLTLSRGVRTGFGPKDEILHDIVVNHKQIQRSQGLGAIQ